MHNVRLYINGVFFRQENNPPYEWGAPSQNDTELASMQQRIETTIQETRELERRIEGADGELREMLERRLEAKRLQVVDDVNELSEGIIKQEKAGDDLGEMRTVVVDYLQRLMPGFQRVIDRERKSILALVSAAPAKELHEAIAGS